MDRLLAEELAQLESVHLRRRLRTLFSAQGPEVVVDGKRLINFSSNDYLGLASESFLIEAVCRAAREYGAGTGASRLISGTQSPHVRLEEELAAFKQLPAALVFGSGYATAVGTIPALVGQGDTVILDKLSHACLVDGARLSGATLRVFGHNDMSKLEALLRGVRQKQPSSRILVITESVFSMDGDTARLSEIVALKEQFGAWLLLDEAHGIGVIGERGQGLAHAVGLQDRIEVQMGTMGKALGVAGGYVAGSRTLVDFLINRSRSFIFSTAPPASQAAAAGEALRWLRGREGVQRIERLRANRQLIAALCPQHVKQEPAAAIVPIHVGDEAEALALASRCIEAGAFIPAVRFPTVPRGKARLRLTLTASHSREQIKLAAQVLASPSPSS